MTARRKVDKTVLVTSGGAIVQIDDVRHIGNFSTGKFMSQISEEALLMGYKLIYLHAKGAVLPFSENFIFDPLKNYSFQFKRIRECQKLYISLRKNMLFFQYETFSDYQKILKDILSHKAVHIAILGAAVSDYGIKRYKGKLSSSQENITLVLSKNPKVIKFVKKWSKRPIFQVGLKLLSNSSEKQLIKVAYESGCENGSDLTIANDFKKIKKHEREVILVTPDGKSRSIRGTKVPQKIMYTIERLYLTNYSKWGIL